LSLYNGASTGNFREYANNARFSATNHTISLWVHPNITPVAQWAWIARGNSTTVGEFTCGTPATSAFNLARSSIDTSVGLQNIADTLPWTNNKWFHYCQTYDGTTLTVWVDGRQRATLVASGTFTQTTTANVRLWMRTDATVGTTDAWLEDFGWWNVAFSAAQVFQLAHGADFTTIDWPHAIILDPLRTVTAGTDLVGGLGTNTGTLTAQELAPTLAYDRRTAPIPVSMRGPGRPIPILRPDRRPGLWTPTPAAPATFNATRFMPFFQQVR
jgi:hypothetical protein